MMLKVKPNARAVNTDDAMTIHIYRDGTARLSQGLISAAGIHSKAVDVQVDTKKKTIIIKNGICFNLWYSNSAAKSPLVSLRSTLTTLELDPVDVTGVYKGVVGSGTIIVDLRKKEK